MEVENINDEKKFLIDLPNLKLYIILKLKNV